MWCIGSDFSIYGLIFLFKLFEFLSFVANRMVFRATCSIRFSVFLSIVLCTPLYLIIKLFLVNSIGFEYAPVSGCVGECVFVSVLGSDF